MNCYTLHYGCIVYRGSKSGISNFSSFYNCHASGHIVICFHRDNNLNVTNINVVNNSFQTIWGLVSNLANSNIYISESIFINNGKIWNKCLFSSDGNIFQIKNSWIQLDLTVSNVNILNNLGITNTFPIYFFSTSLCKGEKTKIIKSKRFSNKIDMNYLFYYFGKF